MAREEVFHRKYQSLDELTPSRKRAIGAIMVSVAITLSGLMHAHPQGLNVPSWVAHMVSGCFGLAGVAVFVHASVSKRAYQWLMVAVLATMMAIPSWIAFGPGERECSASAWGAPSGWLTFLDLEEVQGLGCRIPFALGAALMGVVLAIAVGAAMRPSHQTQAQPDRSKD